jgi:CheY-like chemotaxis protein
MEAVRMSKPTVLLVEDEVLIRALLADVLIDEGYEVVEAGNVMQAVAALGSHSAFDFLITDVDMPGGLSGLDLAAMVANTSPSTRIIVTSGRRFDPDLLRGKCFLPKPYSIERVVELLGGRPATNNAAVGWAAAV